MNQSTCLYCQKKILYPNYIVISRNNGKSTLDLARIIRQFCCCDKCFYNYWNNLFVTTELNF